MPNWLDFEEEIRLLIEAFGYRAERTPASGDHGVDVIATKGGRRVAAQVKLYHHSRVGNQTVQMLLGGMRFYDATEALLITTGKLTNKARELCAKTDVVVYEGNSLLSLCTHRLLVLPSWCALRSAVTGEFHSLESGVIVGRLPDCGISHPTDMTLSRRHFQLNWNGLHLILEDLNSANGTKVNGTEARRVRLKYGDCIEAGKQSWTLEAEAKKS